jgi:uncharacterized damage-inducible protein DinB
MPVPADILRLQLDYSAWASRRLLEAAAQLSSEELNRDFHTADHSLLGTLVHIFVADRVWLARMHRQANPVYSTEADHHLSVLQTEWPALHDRWREWASALSDQDALAELAYNDMKGRLWQQPVWQLVLHVVNHATHHRGQAAGFMRAMGHVPPALDLILYYRELGAAAGRATG